jgi:transposase
MIDERFFEVLRSQLSAEKEEKAALREQLEKLTEEMRILRESFKTEMTAIKQQNRDMSQQNQKLIQQNRNMSLSLEAKDRQIADLVIQFKDAIESVKLGRKYRFAPTTEQRRLLNNRNTDKRAEDKDRFDGSSGSFSGSSDQHTECKKTTPESKRNGKQKPSVTLQKESHYVDETIRHTLDSYYKLPAGARFMNRNGKKDISEYRVIEIQPAKIIEHIYEIASVVMPDGTFVRTMDTPHVAKRCPFTAKMLSFILCEKYVYHTPINIVKKKLRNMGAVFSKSSLNRYYHIGIEALMDFIGDTLKEEVRNTDYLMIDETCELVGIEPNEEQAKCGQGRVYLKKYLWAFYAKLKNLVCYVYEQGSRSRKVVQDFLKKFCGYISTDGYVAYNIFDDADKHPGIVHVGCWTHCRRLFVEALESDRRAMYCIDEIGGLFAVELNCTLCGLEPEERKVQREKQSVPIMTRLYARAKTMSKDMELMSNSLMRKAVNYLLNQWNRLRNFILDGRVQISNNLVEQRMKTVKLNLKNCLNIGSERAAKNAAFMHSIFESCALNHISPEGYIEHLFNSIGQEEVDKRALLPCYYANKT